MIKDPRILPYIKSGQGRGKENKIEKTHSQTNTEESSFF
jgi:hypothetical protein